MLIGLLHGAGIGGDEGGRRRQIGETVFDSFAPQLDLSFAAAIYGLVGLFLGSLIGELLVGLPPAAASLRPMRASPAA